MDKHLKCLICQSKDLKKMKNYYARHGLIKCQSCSFVFMEQIPTIQELNKHYSKYSYTTEGYLSPITVHSYNCLLDEFEKFRKLNKILDIGCGRGWFLQEAQKRGWQVYGTEYSDEAIKLCRAQGLNIKEGKLNTDSFSPEEFDIITSFEVLEHINNPIEEIQNIYKFLRRGGLFYCTTPNFNSYLRYYIKENYNIIAYPEHLSYYTRKTLKNLLTQQGFKPQKILTTGISITRLRTSQKKTNEKFISSQSSDEILRQKIFQNPYLEHVKNFVNFVLSLLGLGMTLKGYFLKP